MDRNLSGIYVLVKGESGYENKDITDCTEKQVRSLMEGRSAEELIDWVCALCKRFKAMGNECDIMIGE